MQGFKAGMAPIAIGLLFATGWILSAQTLGWHHILLTVAAALLVWRTRMNLLVLVGTDALVGAMGWI